MLETIITHRKVGLEHLVLPVLLLAVALTGGLLHAVPVVPAEQVAHLKLKIYKIYRKLFNRILQIITKELLKMNHKDNLETEASTIRAMDYTQKKLLHPYFDAE